MLTADFLQVFTVFAYCRRVATRLVTTLVAIRVRCTVQQSAAITSADALIFRRWRRRRRRDWCSVLLLLLRFAVHFEQNVRFGHLDSRKDSTVGSVNGCTYGCRNAGAILILLLNVVDLMLFHFSAPALVLLAEQQSRIGVFEQHLLLPGGHLIDAVISVEHNGARDPE